MTTRSGGKRPKRQTIFDRFRGPNSASQCDPVATLLRRRLRGGRYTPVDEAERFWLQVQRSPWWRPWGCGRWTGTLNADGYPVFSIFRQGRWEKVRAHRYALELARGVDLPFPHGAGSSLPGWEAGHDCHDRSRCHRGRDCPHRACVRTWEGRWWWPRRWRRPHVIAMTRAENRARVDARRAG